MAPDVSRIRAAGVQVAEHLEARSVGNLGARVERGGGDERGQGEDSCQATRHRSVGPGERG
jgi:hypothetical protein